MGGKVQGIPRLNVNTCQKLSKDTDYYMGKVTTAFKTALRGQETPEKWLSVNHLFVFVFKW